MQQDFEEVQRSVFRVQDRGFSPPTNVKLEVAVVPDMRL